MKVLPHNIGKVYYHILLKFVIRLKNYVMLKKMLVCIWNDSHNTHKYKKHGLIYYNYVSF